jgi:pyruvate formate-lyase activating enzyme-like uncharacterized protein
MQETGLRTRQFGKDRLKYADGNRLTPMAVHDRPYGSLYVGRLPKGCAHCEKGSKMVLFTTGLCPFTCYYCPISLEKRGKDVVFADEMRVRREADIFEEAEAISATGAGMTGGDPLAAIDRTSGYVRLLKKEYGDKFHIHLYTMGTDLRKIARLGKAGLDEIRFHPPSRLWKCMDRSGYQAATVTSRDHGMDVGLEVPLIPDMHRELVAMIGWAEASGLDFVNLNEMEFSDSNKEQLRAKGYRVERGKSHGVAGSDRAARGLLGRKWSITVNYCTSAYKDGWQLRERIKRRARNVSQPWDVVTEDGTLVKGVIESGDLKKVMHDLLHIYHVPRSLVWFNRERHRLEVAPWILEELAKTLSVESYVIEEYPTADHLEVERRKLI